MIGSLYIEHGSEARVQVLGGEFTRFVHIEIGGLTLYFSEYGQAQVEKLREFIEKVTKATDQLEATIVEDQQPRLNFEAATDEEMQYFIEPEPEEGWQHDTLEERRGER